MTKSPLKLVPPAIVKRTVTAPGRKPNAVYRPRQKSGPRRRHDRETVTAFLFAAASNVTLDCLPDCGFPNPLTLRTTWQRWRASGELGAVMAAGQPAAERMARQYRQRVTDLSLRRRPPKDIGKRTATMPKWSHIRPR